MTPGTTNKKPTHNVVQLSILDEESILVNAIQLTKQKIGAMSTFLLSSALMCAATMQVSAQTIPTDGLVLHLEADSGVTVTDMTTDVTGWTDQSTQANDLTAAGAPQLVADAVNGEAAIAFDGTDDILQRLADVMGLPAGDADRTVYTVVNYDSVGYGGVAYGNADINQAFGLIVAPNGNLMIQGWGGPNDFDSGVAGTGMGWMVQSAVHNAGTMTHSQHTPAQVIAQMGALQIDTQVHTYATDPQAIVVGAEIDGDPFMDMDVAAVMIWDRVLTVEETADVENYLALKYLGAVNLEVTAPMEAETVSSGDVDVTYAASGTAFDGVRFVLDGGTPVDVTEASGTTTLTGVAEGDHTLVVTLIDDMGMDVNLANSSVTINFRAEDCAPDNFAPNCTVDTDGDGTPDSVEGETTDTDGDGTVDYLESSTTDADMDGTPDQTDSNDADPCVPSTSGTGCTPPPQPSSSSGGGGSFGLGFLMALGAVAAIRRRRYD